MARHQAALARVSCAETSRHSSHDGKNSKATWSHTLKLKSSDLLLHQSSDRKRSTAVLTADPPSDVCELFPRLPFPAVPGRV